MPELIALCSMWWIIGLIAGVLIWAGKNVDLTVGQFLLILLFAKLGPFSWLILLCTKAGRIVLVDKIGEVSKTSSR